VVLIRVIGRKGTRSKKKFLKTSEEKEVGEAITAVEVQVKRETKPTINNLKRTDGGKYIWRKETAGQ